MLEENRKLGEEYYKLYEKLKITGAIQQFGPLTKVNCRDFTGLLEDSMQTDLFFLQGVEPEKGNRRGGDEDIIAKNCVVFDLDYRKLYPDITDVEIQLEVFNFFDKLKGSKFEMWDYVVFSGNGLHVYYLGQPVTFACAEDRAIWSRGYKLLVNEFNELYGAVLADTACSNVGRIFRVAGSWNCKNKDDKKFVKIIGDNKDQKKGSSNLTKEAMSVGASDNTQQISLVERFKQDSVTVTDFMPELIANDNGSVFHTSVYPGLSIWDCIKRFRARYALGVLGGKEEVDFEEYRFKARGDGTMSILVKPRGKVEFKACEAWIDEKGNIGSARGGGPHISNWLRFYKSRTNEEVEQIVLKYFSDVLPDSAKGVEGMEHKQTLQLNALTEVDIDNMFSDMTRKDKKYFTWGIEGMDEDLPLLEPGRMVLLVGNPGSGKTTMAFQCALENAKKGRKVMFVSLEMDERALLMREVYHRCSLNQNDLRSGAFKEDPEVMARIKEGLCEIMDSGLIIMKGDSADFYMYNDLGKLEQTIDANKPDLVVIDNLSFLNMQLEGERTEYDLQEAVSRKLVDIAKKGVCVMPLHHFRKSANSKNNKSVEDIKGNNKVEIVTDIIVAITRDELELSPQEKEQKKKNPNFFHPTGTFLSPWKNRFGDIGSKMRVRYDKGIITRYLGSPL